MAPFDPAWAELIPEHADIDRIPDELTRSDFYRAAEELRAAGSPERDIAALSWVFRLAQESATLSRIASSLPWLDRIAVGFLDPALDLDGPGFGYVAYSSLDPASASDFNVDILRGRAREEFGMEVPPERPYQVADQGLGFGDCTIGVHPLRVHWLTDVDTVGPKPRRASAPPSRECPQ